VAKGKGERGNNCVYWMGHIVCVQNEQSHGRLSPPLIRESKAAEGPGVHVPLMKIADTRNAVKGAKDGRIVVVVACPESASVRARV
jgi:hypothetical protein